MDGRIDGMQLTGQQRLCRAQTFDQIAELYDQRRREPPDWLFRDLFAASGLDLAFTTGGHAFPPGFDPFFEQIQACYQAIGSNNLRWPPPPPERVADQGDEITRSGLFEDVRVLRRVWSEGFTADEHIALMRTASDHRLMDPEKREWLFAQMRRLIDARPGRMIRKHNLTLLHLARKRSLHAR